MAIYYVKTDGSDSYSGLSDVSAWATWNKAFIEASAGDTVYFKGGVYYSSGVSTAPIIDPYGFVPKGHSGTAENPIRFFADPSDYIAGNYPILDCSGQTSISSIVSGIRLVSCQYIHFKGLTIRNVFQEASISLGQGISIEFTANMTFENMTIHNIHGRGVGGECLTGYYDNTVTPVTIQCDNTKWINCDFYDLCDLYSDNPGNAADGIKITLDGRTDSSYGIPNWYLYGCRVWNYSDDGFDIGGPSFVKFQNCWVSSTQKYAEYIIEGNGFKDGLWSPLLNPSDASLGYHWREYRSCIAANCAGSGFFDMGRDYRNNALYYNNMAYACGESGFRGNSVWDPSFNPKPSQPPRNSAYYNNITWLNCPSSGYGDYWYEVILYREVYPESNNTWDMTTDGDDWPGWAYAIDVSIKSADFLSLDSSELFSKPRKSDGSLPDVSFGHLTANASLIYTGIYLVDACIYDGEGKLWHNPPSIGPFEYDGPNASIYSIPAVTTSSATSITTITAFAGGNVTHDGSTLTYRGICWSTSTNPTVSDSSLRDVTTGMGTYTIYMPGLDVSTHYHVRAFAYNSEGISYGIDVSFNTISLKNNIIANHTIVDDYDIIPMYYINEVKKMWMSYPGESHAMGILKGLELLEASYGTYSVDTRYYTISGDPTPYTDASLRASTALWGKWLTPTGWWYEIGERDWWTNSNAISGVKASLAYCSSTGPSLAAVCFGWCWDHTRGTASAGTDPIYGCHWYGRSLGSPSGDLPWGIDVSDNAVSGNSVNMDTYLNATQQYVDYCSSMGYSTKVFFTTAPMDGVNGEFDYEELKEVLFQGNLKNEHIRSYVNCSDNKILFDYADILAYDYSNDVSTQTWNNNTYPTITKINETGEYAHISYIATVRLAKAMWWMLARIAGWDGNSGNLYYVATDGSDSYPGTISQPWATFQHAVYEVSAGDIVYFRGGTYYPNHRVYITSAYSGTNENHITYSGYPGETVIFDMTNYIEPPNYVGHTYASAIMINAGTGYLDFKNFTICNVLQHVLYTQVTVIYSQWTHNLTFENICVHDNGGRGFMCEGGMGYYGITSDKTSYINCDSYNNFDSSECTPGAVPGNQADGFKFYGEPGSELTYRGCRAWNNSDDGWDVGTEQKLLVENCWSFQNGFQGAGDGDGFKTGSNYIHESTYYKIFKNNISAYNQLSSFFLLDYPVYYRNLTLYYNNLAVRNGGGFSTSLNSIHPVIRSIWRNNISYDISNGYPFSNAYQQYTESNNTWKLVGGYPGFEEVYTITSADFVSLDVSQLSRPRKADGSLPDVSFGHLSATSPLIGKGMNLGLSSDGNGSTWKNPPSIGAFEYEGDSSTLTLNVSTNAITDVSSYTATSGGNVIHDGSIALTYRGICWSSDLLNPTVFDASSRDTSTGEGSYVSYLTNLNANTKYHVKAFAYNSDGIAYGQDVSFYTSPGLPTIKLVAIDLLTTTDVSIYSLLTNDGSSAITDRGVCWDTSVNPTTSNYIMHETSDNAKSITGEIGFFTCPLSNLNSGTVYYFRSFATNAYGTAYSDNASTRTITIPTVVTTAISDITTITASGGGNVTSDGSTAVTDRGVCWGITSAPDLDGSHTHDSSGAGVFTSYLTGLNPSTHYYVRAYAINSVNTVYGSAVQFTTLSTDASTSSPTVTTSAISDISTYTATGSGNVTSDGSIALTYRGICWSTSASPTTLDASSRDSSTGTGSYSLLLTSLSASTHYYVRAFAYNSQGTAYGIDVSFNTLSEPSPTPDSSLSYNHIYGYRTGNTLFRYNNSLITLRT